jgi:hypothetical protein
MKRLKHLFSVILFLSTMLSAMHHHNDFKPHADCQICTIQHNISDGDTPHEILYVEKILNFSDPVVTALFSLHVSAINSTNSSRAPPVYS